jgi:hypothetical protein
MKSRTVKCPACGADSAELVASICANVLGDEYTDSCFQCRECQQYCLESCRERFSGAESVALLPIEATIAQDKIERIRACATPMNKHCQCPAHQQYFGFA